MFDLYHITLLVLVCGVSFLGAGMLTDSGSKEFFSTALLGILTSILLYIMLTLLDSRRSNALLKQIQNIFSPTQLKGAGPDLQSLLTSLAHVKKDCEESQSYL